MEEERYGLTNEENTTAQTDNGTQDTVQEPKVEQQPQGYEQQPQGYEQQPQGYEQQPQGYEQQAGQNFNGQYNGYYNNGQGYNNNYNNNYNNYSNNPKKNNSGKRKIAIAVCVVAILGGLGIAGTGFIGAMNYINTFGSGDDSDKIAWEQKDGQDDDKNEETPSSTMKPVSVTEAASGIGTVTDVSGIVEAVMPSVVSITSTSSMEGYSIFGQRYSQEISSAGTGFIVGENDDELLLATNNHVVEDATAVQVTFIDESTAEAVVKGTNAQADLAVVAVSKKDISNETKEAIKVAVLGDSDDVKVGQVAVAIGNAQGMGQSVTVGYISAKDRKLDMSDSATGGTKTMNFLQTDAAINGGNSGGPLIDINGNVVGINSAKISDTQVEGMCFAIPISSAIPIINELMNRETLTDEERGYLGVSLQNISADAVEMYNVPDGVYVANVVSGSGADKAGIKKGDIITEIDGVAVNSSSAATDKINSYRAGTEIEIVIYRQSESGSGYESSTVKATLVTAEEAGINSADNNSNGADKGSSEKNDSGSSDGKRRDYYGDEDVEDWFGNMFQW